MNRTPLLILAIVLGVVLFLGLAALIVIGPRTDAPAPAAPASAQDPAGAGPRAEEAFSLEGVWQSDEDPKFIRTFDDAGAVIDTYEGFDDATARGSWNVVEDPSAEQEELPDLDGARIIKIQFPEEVLYFAVIELTADSLQLSYLGRGNTLSFTRIR